MKESHKASWRIRGGPFLAITALVALVLPPLIASAAPTPIFMGLGTTSTCRIPSVTFSGSTVVGRCQKKPASASSSPSAGSRIKAM